MSDEREKLLNVMKNLESDYKSGKISAEKYSYFKSKYEDKLNSIDAKAATRRIRSMQGKSSNDTKKRLHKKPTKNKKKEEQDLVQKYIINPKKDDSRYNKKKKSSMDSGTFKLLLLLILVVGFTAGIAYGIFNFDVGTITDSETVATVSDTAFPEFKVDNVNKTVNKYENYSYYDNDKDYDEVETTTETTTTTYTDSSSSDNYQDSGSSSQQSSDSSQGGSQSTGGGGSSDSGSDGGGSNDG